MKRVQLALDDDAWSIVENLMKDANEGFEAGNISLSDAMNEIVLTSKVDIKILQLKHTDVRRAVKAMADKADFDIDSLIKNLQELKSRTTKRLQKSPSLAEVSE